MKLKKILESIKGLDRIPYEFANELLAHGITDFLEEGCSYEYAVDILDRAEISVQRQKAQGA